MVLFIHRCVKLHKTLFLNKRLMSQLLSGKIASKLFIDSGDVAHTRRALEMLGFLDGQTTNPSLVAKSPDVERCKQDGTCSEQDILNIYKDIVSNISNLIPEGSVSVEVYADADTTKDTMLEQARAMNEWIPNAHIKLPIIAAGLEAAEMLVSDGITVNRTLCFPQEQAAEVHMATKGDKPGQIFVSPFMGRLDDKGENGMDLIENCVRMYKSWGSHVAVLAASIRSSEHIVGALAAGADILTIPMKALEPWHEQGYTLPDDGYTYDAKELQPISYKELEEDAWDSYDIHHELTDVGIEKFAKDWRTLFVEAS